MADVIKKILEFVMLFFTAVYSRKAGADAEIKKAQSRTIETVAKAKEVRERVDAMSDADVTSRLRERWTKPD